MAQRSTRAAENAAAGKEAADLRRQLEAWSRRHTDADPDSDQECEAAAKILELKRALKQLRDRAAGQAPAPLASASPISRDRIAAYLRSLGDLVSKSSDQGKMLVQSLVEHHGLQVHVIDDYTLRMSLRLRPPGSDVDATEDFAVAIEGDARLPSDKITAWVEGQQGKTICACGCGRPVMIRRRHYWMGVPEFRSDCRYKGMARRRAQLSAGLYTGQKVATLLGIGRTTVNRWVTNGKLPVPQRSISNMLLFDRIAIDRLVKQRATNAAK
jgi:predicted DNA-binding transcriptional regulator AlpA